MFLCFPPGPGLASKSHLLWLFVGPGFGGSLCAAQLPVWRSILTLNSFLSPVGQLVLPQVFRSLCAHMPPPPSSPQHNHEAKKCLQSCPTSGNIIHNRWEPGQRGQGALFLLATRGTSANRKNFSAEVPGTQIRQNGQGS